MISFHVHHSTFPLMWMPWDYLINLSLMWIFPRQADEFPFSEKNFFLLSYFTLLSRKCFICLHKSVMLRYIGSCSAKQFVFLLYRNKFHFTVTETFHNWLCTISWAHDENCAEWVVEGIPHNTFRHRTELLVIHNIYTSKKISIELSQITGKYFLYSKRRSSMR